MVQKQEGGDAAAEALLVVLDVDDIQVACEEADDVAMKAGEDEEFQVLVQQADAGYHYQPAFGTRKAV